MNLQSISRYISLILRHKPEVINIMGVFITIINELKLRDNVDVEFEILAEEFKR